MPGIVSRSSTRESARASGRSSLKRREATVEPVDHCEGLGDRAPPHLWHPARLEQRRAVGVAHSSATNQSRDTARQGLPSWVKQQTNRSVCSWEALLHDIPSRVTADTSS